MKQTRRTSTARDWKNEGSNSTDLGEAGPPLSEIISYEVSGPEQGLHNVKRTLKQVLSVAAVSATPFCSFGVEILSGPSFEPATNAPLAGVLRLTTDIDSRVSISVTDGAGRWERNFYDYNSSHSVPLLGFKPDRTNEITVTVRDKYRNRVTAAKVLSFVTGPLPVDFPKISLLTNQPAKMEPGYTLFRATNTGANGYVTIVNSSGEVVWYDTLPTLADVQQLENGNLFMPAGNGFAEINLLGESVNVWLAPDDLLVDVHDGILTDHGTILYINNTTQVVDNFPSSATDPNAPLVTTNVSCNRLIEISATNSQVLGNWSLMDMLDPRRIDYLTFLLPIFGVDAQHANALFEDRRDDSIIVSLRNQDAVVKFSRAGQIKWILGPHENWGPAWQKYLLTPVGTPFEWQYGQHAPVLTPQGTLLLYDNGNLRAEPFQPTVPDVDNHSRAVEYSIDENKMEITQVWDYGRTNADRLYTDRVGSAYWLPKRENVLITFGFVLYVNGLPCSPYAPGAVMVRIKEVTHDQNSEVVFDLQVFDTGNTNTTYQGSFGYRSRRIPDLYGHLVKPIDDLTVKIKNGTPSMEFSADQTRIYAIEASNDLVNWSEIGVATPDEESAGFNFNDPQLNASARFYRVRAQE